MTSSRASRTSYMSARDGVVPAADDPLLAFAPVPHKQLRRNTIGPERQRAFVAHLAATGIVRQAARHIGASIEALYKLRHRPGAEDFAAAWDEAVDRGVQRLEDCALARAIEGEERLVVSGGKVLGTEVRHNKALTMFFLRGRRPDRYGSAHEITLRPGHPVYEKVRADIRARNPAPDIEDIRAEVLRKVAALERHQARYGVEETRSMAVSDPEALDALFREDDEDSEEG